MFKRDKYLNQLIRSRDNHQVKVITVQNVALQDENGVYTVPLGCLKP